MRDVVLGYLVRTIATRKIDGPVIDFGGTIVSSQAEYNGAVKSLFPRKNYQTFDLEGADIIGDIYDTKLESNSIGTALCLETLEHLAEPKKAIQEIYRILKPKGLIIITTMLNWEIHRYPKDYWRFLPEGLEFVMEGFVELDITTEHPVSYGTPNVPTGIFATAVKP